MTVRSSAKSKQVARQQPVVWHHVDMEALQRSEVPAKDKVGLLHKLSEVLCSSSGLFAMDRGGKKSIDVPYLLHLCLHEWPVSGDLSKSPSTSDVAVQVGRTAAYHSIRRVAVGTIALLLQELPELAGPAMRDNRFLDCMEQLLFDTAHRYRYGQSYSRLYGDFDKESTCQAQFIYERLVAILAKVCAVLPNTSSCECLLEPIQTTCARIVLSNFRIDDYYKVQEQLALALTPEESLNRIRPNRFLKDPFPDTLLSFLKELVASCDELAMVKHLDAGILDILHSYQPFMYYVDRYKEDLRKLQDTYHALHLKRSRGKIDSIRQKLERTKHRGQQLHADGDRQMRQDNFSAAIATYKEALRFDWSNPEIMCKLATCFLRTKQLPLALDAAVAAVTLDPDFAPSWYYLAQASLANKHFEAAAIAATHAFCLEPAPGMLELQIETFACLSKLMLAGGERDHVDGLLQILTDKYTQFTPDRSSGRANHTQVGEGGNSSHDEAGAYPYCVNKEVVLEKFMQLERAKLSADFNQRLAGLWSTLSKEVAGVPAVCHLEAVSSFDKLIVDVFGAMVQPHNAGQLQKLVKEELGTQLGKSPQQLWLPRSLEGYALNVFILPAVAQFVNGVAELEDFPTLEQVLQAFGGEMQELCMEMLPSPEAALGAEKARVVVELLRSGALSHFILTLKGSSCLSSDLVAYLPISNEWWKVSYDSMYCPRPMCNNECMFSLHVCMDVVEANNFVAFPHHFPGLPCSTAVMRALFKAMLNRCCKPCTVIVAHRLAYMYDEINSTLASIGVKAKLECRKGAERALCRWKSMNACITDMFGLNCDISKGRFQEYMM